MPATATNVFRLPVRPQGRYAVRADGEALAVVGAQSPVDAALKFLEVWRGDAGCGGEISLTVTDQATGVETRLSLEVGWSA